MPVKWKNPARFKPSLVLAKIDAVRTLNPSGKASFGGFGLEENLPTLQSMLEFPPAACDVDVASLLWGALSKAPTPLTATNVLAAINEELKDTLATKEDPYHAIVSMSLNNSGLPKRIKIDNVEIRLPASGIPKAYQKPHETVVRERLLAIPATPVSYSYALVKVRAKSKGAAMSRAFRALDLQRALWCLMGNPAMQLTFGSPGLQPINVVRYGSRHTLHNPDGSTASDGIWFEPGFMEAKVFGFDNPSIVTKNSRWALKQISGSKYGDRLSASLARFVCALDESDANSAFVRLWGALEMLTTPNKADYDQLVRRCAFIFKDRDYHWQVLEHLREYRNSHLHGGHESSRARTHCFQLQMYFSNLIWFHIYNATYFQSLDEANGFLDSPVDKRALQRQLQLSRKAVKFITPAGEA